MPPCDPDDSTEPLPVRQWGQFLNKAYNRGKTHPARVARTDAMTPYSQFQGHAANLRHRLAVANVFDLGKPPPSGQ